MTLDGRTQVHGILGYPVKHSLSPVFQNRAFEHFSINAVYVPFEVKPEDFEPALSGLKALGIRGVNITLPHKERALELADFKDRHAEAIGSANTLKVTEEGIYAYNTDWIGFLKSVRKLTPELSGIKALVLGAGGSARAIVYALRAEGAEVFLWNRTRERAESLCEHFGCRVVESVERVLEEVELIVNTTSSGLRGDDPPIFDYGLLRPEHRVMDIIYSQTPLLKAAMEKGCPFQDGLDMLLYQGMESFKIWTGLEVPYEVVRKAVEEYRG
ncbi:MAG: shikimate dehydrogenase [Aquificaceae bacterium]|jgi:shikimate dehydrogenase|uniref:shikimate dehydrogenase n=1 Tax=Hydrogenobacter sp. Uz 6-8 TaxID=3384828 RepID=UPI0030B518F6